MPIKKTYSYQKYDLNTIDWQCPEFRILEMQSKMSDLARAERQKEKANCIGNVTKVVFLKTDNVVGDVFFTPK